MHCILIGVSPSEIHEGELLTELSRRLTKVKEFPVVWIATSAAHDEDGTLTQLLSVITEADVDDVLSATSKLLHGHSCEVWASSPAIFPLRPSGGYNKYLYFRNGSTHFFEEWSPLAMKEWGMFVQKALLTLEEVEILRKLVIEQIENAERMIQFYHPAINIGRDSMCFKEIASRGNNRFDLLLDQSSLPYRFVQEIIFHRISLNLEKLIGSIHTEIDCDVSVVYSKPGAPDQGWHSDGDHQKGTMDAGWDSDGWKHRLSDPYALCLFIPLVQLSDHTGYTQFWPASHRYKDLMGFGRVAEIAEATWNGKCEAGDAIWYDYRLMHRGIGNASSLLRPILQLLFKKKWYIEKRNYGDVSIKSVIQE